MTKRPKTRLTFKKIRLALFLRSYAFHRILKELRKKYSGKNVSKISRLSHVLNLSYKPLWKAIILEKFQPFNKRILNKEKIKIYLAIESELILLSMARSNKSDFKDSDYEEDFALLSMAIERVVGDSLKEIKDDLVFSKQLEALQGKYIYWYYKTAFKYKLPTIRIAPFILRLIT